jgi:uncharacterized protein (TIGR02001 family)
MKKTLVSLSILALSAAATAQTAPAAAAPAAPEPDLSVSYNVGVITDYCYRGISQSRLEPALQGGFDLAHKNGLYFGVWGSTIKWIKDGGTIAGVDTGSNFLEVDVYGGYKGELTKDVTYDVGLLQYWYPSNNYQAAGYVNANTLETYAAVTSGPLTVKYSHALTDLFGNGAPATSRTSNGSGYLDISTSFELTKGLTLVPHIGRQVVKNYPEYSYNDYSLALNKEFDGGYIGSATLVANSTRDDLAVVGGGTYAYYTPGNQNMAKTAIVLGLKKNF